MKKNKATYRSIILLIFGFYCFICITLIPAGTLLIRQESGSWGDIFSLGQFLTDLCLIPFAIFAFYYTLYELRKSQEHADFNIGWEIPTGMNKTYSDNRPMSANFYSPSIVLSNKGTAPSIHYQITLEIPTEIGRTKMTNPNLDWKGSHQGDFQKFIFTSASHLISFPNAPFINLGKIEFTETALLPEEIVIKYYIASDKDEYKSGKITINFIENKKLEK